MVYKIGEATISATVGGKAHTLSVLKRAGFLVPSGFIIDHLSISNITTNSGTDKEINKLLSTLSKGNIEDISSKIQSIISTLAITDQIKRELNKRVKKGVRYAVRSSGLQEDTKLYSFAGQYETYLNVTGIDNVSNKIIACYNSMYDVSVLSYIVDHKLDKTNLKMAVVIQEMVVAKKSGVIFTINPKTGNDKEMVAEVTRGLADNLVSGKVVPERYIYNWYEQKDNSPSGNRLLNPRETKMIMNSALELQVFFGYPVDIEFAIQDGFVYILQARPITQISYTGIPDQWSMADFRDGVSASVCTPMMWSLYEYIWETMLPKFFIETKMMEEKELRKLGGMFYGRPYWNVTVVKSAMSKIPGYIEKDFDKELGIMEYYPSEGQITGLSPKSLLNVLRMVLPQKKVYKKQKSIVTQHKKSTLSMYRKYKNSIKSYKDLPQLEKKWRKLVKEDYLTVEGTYFWQIYVNIVRQTLYKEKILKHINRNAYIDLLSGLDDVSHLRPALALQSIAQAITADDLSSKYWLNNSVSKIIKRYKTGSEKYVFKEVRTFITNYGYHSDKELDITHPSYFEDPRPVVAAIKDMVKNLTLDDKRAIVRQSAYTEQLRTLQDAVSTKKYRKLLASTEDIRKLLWWREELKDLSTRTYYLIRIYTLELAKNYVDKDILDHPDDIFFLTINDMFMIMDKTISSVEVNKIIDNNKLYYQSFRNYDNPSEVGSIYKPAKSLKSRSSKDVISGVGSSNGIVTGTARVIEGIKDIEKIKPHDILVTVYTDTGWTSKFAEISGIVTERGGILCHAAIVAREYGIPCVVSVEDATTTIIDGSTIEVNGSTGEIRVIKR